MKTFGTKFEKKYFPQAERLKAILFKTVLYDDARVQVKILLESGIGYMRENVPRYEFRAFAQNFGLVEDKMRELYTVDSFRESSEIYIISKGIKSNVKIHYNLLDIKVLLKEEMGLQQCCHKNSLRGI